MNMSGGVGGSDPVLVEEAAEGFERVEFAGYRLGSISFLE